MVKTISVCVIARNEEQVLTRCLQGAALFADELIVLDTGSDDSTKEIARRYTTRSMTPNGRTILRRPETPRLQKPAVIISCGWMRMIWWTRKTPQK